jgi:mannitol 2-dehydrogenase
MAVKLSLANLDQIAARAAVPNYRREDLKAGIVHFGVGNFHRAHLAVYLDALFRKGKNLDWAIIGAGVMPSDDAMREKLAAQDFLTTIVEQDNDRSSAHVTGAMIDFLSPKDKPKIIETLSNPDIRIVSLTITEGGYFINPALGVFDPQHPAIVADGQSPDLPKTVFGLILAGLKQRRDQGIAPFTVMSCDNIPGNGEVTRAALVGLARLSDPEFADWVEHSVAFPSAMVDRITPATGPRELKITREAYGIDDAWPVFCEEFKQWVLEDHFPLGRPSFEEVGAQFVEDVAPYEHMKIRILNGGHAAIAYPAALLDIHFVHDAMEDATIRGFLAKLEQDEIIPIVPPVPDTNLDDYYRLIERRLFNSKIGDTIPRLAQDGSNRQPKFILPSTADRLAGGQSITGLSLVSALWCHYLAGKTDGGKQIVFNDPNADRICAAAQQAEVDPLKFLELDDIFGNIGTNSVFRAAFSTALKSLQTRGTRETLEHYIRGAEL